MALRKVDATSAVPANWRVPAVPAVAPPAPPPIMLPRPAYTPAYRGLLSMETRAGRIFLRGLEALPGALTWLLITSPLWAGLLLPLPFALAVLAFDLFWLYLSATTAWRAVIGYRRLQKAEQTDWQREHLIAQAFGRAYGDWEEIFHIVIIPTYKEPLAILQRTVTSLAAQENAAQLYVVIATEAREQDAPAKAQALIDEFRAQFAGMIATAHPAGLPGEVVGKSANENWAAREAKRLLVDEAGHDLRHLTVTSCDADTVFHPAYFSYLTYLFSTDPHRHRRFWQSAIMLSNNIWETPAALRVGSALAGVHILSNLAKRDRVFFPQSTYSLSLQMAHDVGYWDPDIIPEDWHMFLKCFFAFSGGVEVEPIYLRTGNDAVNAGSRWKSYVEAYQQHKRHAWGASDIPYAIRAALAHTEMGVIKRVRRVRALVANHMLWTTHWFVLTIGWWGPWAIDKLLGRDLEHDPLHMAARVALTLCLVPYVSMIWLDSRLRPPKPATWSWREQAVALVMWTALPVTSFFFSTAPAIVAQTRLMIGKRLEYRVTEKA